MRVCLLCHHSNILPYIHSHSLRQSERLPCMISYPYPSSFLYFVHNLVPFFVIASKSAHITKGTGSCLWKLLNFSMFSPCLGILIASALLIVKQLLTWFAKTLSDEKHCRQYMQKRFLSLCFHWLYMMGSKILNFGSHYSANFQLIMDCFITKFK